MPYDGPDRRDPHCDAHERNTQTLATLSADMNAIKGGINAARWLFGIALVVSMAVIGSWINDIKEDIKEIKADQKALGSIGPRLERLEATVDYNSGRILALERRP